MLDQEVKKIKDEDNKVNHKIMIDSVFLSLIVNLPILYGPRQGSPVARKDQEMPLSHALREQSERRERRERK